MLYGSTASECVAKALYIMFNTFKMPAEFCHPFSHFVWNDEHKTQKTTTVEETLVRLDSTNRRQLTRTKTD